MLFVPLQGLDRSGFRCGEGWTVARQAMISKCFSAAWRQEPAGHEGSGIPREESRCTDCAGGAILPRMAQPQIRPLIAADRDAALAVINAAARWYRDFLPAGELHDPEMTPAQWEAETQRMTWYGAFVEGTLVGVMGLEYAKDVALLRHAYVRAEYQREGIGTCLREHLEAQVRGVRRIIVGTYRENYKARRMLERAGYTLSPDPEAVLRTYYSIPEDRLKSSVTYEKSL